MSSAVAAEVRVEVAAQDIAQERPDAGLDLGRQQRRRVGADLVHVGVGAASADQEPLEREGELGAALDGAAVRLLGAERGEP